MNWPALKRKRLTTLALAVLLFAASRLVAAADFISESSVGFPVRLQQLVLPGSELEAVPWDDKTLVVVQIEAVYPHGTAFRYDLVYHALEPGEYELRKFLRRKDGTLADDLPPLPVKIKSLLPPGQVRPHQVAFGRLPQLGGYRTLLAVGAILWIAGLVWIVYPRGGRKVAQDAEPERQSLAERLRPLVTRAMRGELSTAELAELERALEGYWRRRLRLEHLPAAEAVSQMRRHPEAGPLVTQVETWLHRPGGDREVDVSAILLPYQNLPADAFDESSVVATTIPA
jgi:hypothetical protein